MIEKIKEIFHQHKKKSIILIVLLGIFFISLILWGYIQLFTPNTTKTFSLYIRTNADFQQVIDSLQYHQALKDFNSFKWTAKFRKYTQHVKPGHYLIKEGVSNWDLVKKLRAGEQDPVTIRFESKRTLKEVTKNIAQFLELSDNDLFNAALNLDFLNKHGLTPETVIAIFIPNTYQVYWNIKPDKLLEFFVEEYKKFFAKHQKQLEILGMTPIQISILASIVEAETYRDEEKKRIAGVYYNRLKKNMRLQADPTVIFASGDFTKNRVLSSDLQIDSPYNTYKYKGLPVGPINTPGIASLEATLYPEQHDYIFFCAKPDFSGYHDFSSDFKEHQKQAVSYRNALEKYLSKKK